MNYSQSYLYFILTYNFQHRRVTNLTLIEFAYHKRERTNLEMPCIISFFCNVVCHESKLMSKSRYFQLPSQCIKIRTLLFIYAKVKCYRVRTLILRMTWESYRECCA